MDIVDHLGAYLKSLPPTVQNLIGITTLVALCWAFAYALVTPDPICVGCP